MRVAQNALSPHAVYSMGRQAVGIKRVFVYVQDSIICAYRAAGAFLASYLLRVGFKKMFRK